MDKLVKKIIMSEINSYMKIEGIADEFYISNEEEASFEQLQVLQEVLKKLYEYEQMEEKGLLKLLPVNVGDTVYTNFSMQGWYFRKKYRPYKAKVVFIGINNSDNFMNVVFENDNMLEFKFSEIGKRVFLTEEAAKQKLEEME